MLNIDIVKALEALPLWKRLTALPDRVDHLERRLAALEASAKATPGAGKCNFCQGRLEVIGETPDPTFGAFGTKLLTLKCQNPTCAKETTRQSKS